MKKKGVHVGWIPTLYFAEGPMVVMTVAVIMYKRFGLSNTDIALCFMALSSWVIKPFWSPFVDILASGGGS